MAQPQTSDVAQVSKSLGSNKLFKAVSKNIPILGGTTNSYIQLEKNGSGLVDILNKYQWKNSGSSDEVPSIFATEYELDFGAWYQNIANAFTVVKDVAGVAANAVGLNVNLDKIDPYLKMYAASETGFKYRFPWLLNNGSNMREISHSWSEVEGFGSIFKSGRDAMNTSNVKKSLLGDLIGSGIAGAQDIISPSIGYEQVKQYTGTTSQSITITFPLYNTVTLEKAYDNWLFVQLFTFQNLKTRTSFMTQLPPKLYNLDAYAFGGLYWPIAYISNLKIDSIGTTRDISNYFNTGNRILIPEAYRVSITFQELLPQSSNIFLGTMGGKKVTVTNTGEENGTKPATPKGGGAVYTKPPVNLQTLPAKLGTTQFNSPVLNYGSTTAVGSQTTPPAAPQTQTQTATTPKQQLGADANYVAPTTGL